MTNCLYYYIYYDIPIGFKRVLLLLKSTAAVAVMDTKYSFLQISGESAKIENLALRLSLFYYHGKNQGICVTSVTGIRFE